MENEINLGDADSFTINSKNMNDMDYRYPKLLLFYKSDLKPLNIIYSNKLDRIITQNHIEKRGKRTQLNIKSPSFKDNSSKWTSRLFKGRSNNLDCLKDINTFVWSTISKDIPKWAQVEGLKNSYFNSIDLTPFYPSLEIMEASFPTDLQETLFKIATLSKKFPDLSRAASNAISILSKLGYSLSDKDLQSVNIPFSDLSHTLNINTNFQNSNLNFVNFSQSSLHNVNFKNCNLENAKFTHHLPLITCKQIGAWFDFSKCGRYLAAFGSENEEVIRVWDIVLDILIKQINTGDLKLLNLLRFSPSGQYITTIKEGIVTLFDQRNDYKLITFEGFRKNACCFAFSSCETYIAAGSLNKTIKVWYLKTKEIIHNLCGDQVIDLAFSPCNKFFYSAGNREKDSFIIVWALQRKNILVPYYKGKIFMNNKQKKGKKLLKRFQDDNLVRSIAPSNNGKFIISLSTNISIWNIDLGEKIFTYSKKLHWSVLPLIPYSTLLISMNSFNRINLIAARTDDGRILAFNIETQQFIYETYCNSGKASKQLVFAPNVNSIAVASEGGISFFDVASWNDNKLIMQNKCIVNSISFSPCGKYFVTHCGEAKIELWDISLHKLVKHIGDVSMNSAEKVIMYSFYGTYIATPLNNAIFIYSPDLDFLNKLWEGPLAVRLLAITHDEKLIVSGDIYNKITLWNVQDLKNCIAQVRRLKGINDIQYLGFSRNIEILISCADNNKIDIWSLQNMKCIKTFKRRKENIVLQVSPCNHLMAYTSELWTKIFLYNLQSNVWEKEALICSASSPYKYLKFSPSGKYIAALSIKCIEAKLINEIYIWNIESKQLLSSFQESSGAITCFEFSYSENIIAVGIKNCIFKFWDWEKMIVIK